MSGSYIPRDYRKAVLRKFKFEKMPYLDVEKITESNRHIYIRRNIAEYQFRNWHKNCHHRGNTNIIISAPAGTGKTTFIKYMMEFDIKEINFISIDTREFFREGNNFNRNAFYSKVYRELNYYLTLHGREQRPVSPESVKSDPEYLLDLLLEKRFSNETLHPLFLLIDNIDVKPVSLHEESLNACQVLLAQPNIRLIFASRRRFTDYIRRQISSDFYGWFDIVIDLPQISYFDVISKRFHSVKATNYKFPLTDNSVDLIQNYSNDNLRTALRLTQMTIDSTVLNDWNLPLIYDYISCSLYQNGQIPKVYSLFHQSDDSHPIYLKVLHFLRFYHRVSHKLFTKLNRLYGYSKTRVEKVCDDLVANRFFDKEILSHFQGEPSNNYQTTSRVGELFRMIDCGLIYQFHELFDVPRFINDEIAFTNYGGNPWGPPFREPIKRINIKSDFFNALE